MNKEVISVINPATQATVSKVPVCSKAEVDNAVDKAHKAQKSWEALSFKERIKYFEKLRKEILQNQDEIINVIQSETGKTFPDAATEVISVCGFIAYYAKRLKERNLSSSRQTQVILANKKAMSTHQPWPVVGIITPWNLPFDLPLGETIPYLMMGSAVVVKPSEYTPLSAILAQNLCERVGIPDNIFQVLTGNGETGAALVKSNVDYISFTGSDKTGRIVANQCGKTLTPCSLELGGKTPFLILENVNKKHLERAVHCAVWSAFTNTGQYCKSTERLYVVEKHADYVIDEIKKLTLELQAKEDYGPIIPSFQIDIVLNHIKDAKAKGAQVITGGTMHPELKGHWFLPTVVTDVNHDMLIMQKETFGPTIAIQIVKDDEEAVHYANDCQYGLNAVVFSSNIDYAISVAKRIEAGSVTINDALINYMIPSIPYGGVKSSGWGRRHGMDGNLEIARQKTILIHRFPFPFNKDLWWLPHNKKAALLFKHLPKLNRFFVKIP